jgi:hypothetical protein
MKYFLFIFIFIIFNSCYSVEKVVDKIEHSHYVLYDSKALIILNQKKEKNHIRYSATNVPYQHFIYKFNDTIKYANGDTILLLQNNLGSIKIKKIKHERY